MHIDSISNTNFGAKVARKRIKVLRKGPDGGYKDYFTRLLEFDIKNQNDMQKIIEICKMPEFALYSYELPHALMSGDAEIYKKHCFVLTKDSEKKLADIDKDDVLGIFTFYETAENSMPNIIKFFITNLKYRTRWDSIEREKEFMHIGRGMAQAAQEMFPKKPVCCYSEPWAVRFWEKNGYKEISEQHMLLEKQ